MNVTKISLMGICRFLAESLKPGFWYFCSGFFMLVLTKRISSYYDLGFKTQGKFD